MRIAVGNDHRGVGMKERVLSVLSGLGHMPHDFGSVGPASVDYTDYAFKVCEAVVTGTAERGVLICATGHGMCMAANKVRGIRAANCRDPIDAELSRQQNDANVLCLSGDLIGDEMLERIVKAWLATGFDGGRHARRLEKMGKYEVDTGK